MVSIPGQETASIVQRRGSPASRWSCGRGRVSPRALPGYVLTGQDQRMRISEQTRHRVLRAAAEMNYRPNVMARSLRTVVTRPIAIVSDTLATEAYGGELIEGCLSEAAQPRPARLHRRDAARPESGDALVEEFLAEQVEHFVFAVVYPREVVPAAARPFAGRDAQLRRHRPGRPGGPARRGRRRPAGRPAAPGHGLADRVWLVGDRAHPRLRPGRDREQGLAREQLAWAATRW